VSAKIIWFPARALHAVAPDDLYNYLREGPEAHRRLARAELRRRAGAARRELALVLEELRRGYPPDEVEPEHAQ
jgi:hypothetical protein